MLDAKSANVVRLQNEIQYAKAQVAKLKYDLEQKQRDLEAAIADLSEELFKDADKEEIAEEKHPA